MLAMKHIITGLLLLLGIGLHAQVADFTVNPAQGCSIPHTTFFTDQSTNPDTWAWDFGDGNTSTLQNPVHNYTSTGTFTVVLTITDTILGTTSSHSETVTVGDFVAPTITCPATQNVFFDSQCRFTLPDYTSMATVTDVCDPSPTLTQSPAIGTFIFGNTSVTITATDASGNSSNCSFNVNPTDNTPPSITCPGTQNDFFDGNCQFSLPDYSTMATTSDNCATTVSVSQSPAVGTLVSANTTITLIADDGNGNVAVCTFNLTLSDTISPSVTCPGNQTVSFDANCEYSMADFTSMASATDNCGGVTLTQSPTSGTTITSTTTVTITAEDASGNTSTCNFDVTPEDNTEPSITCPGNQTGFLNSSCENALPDFASLTSATDNCDPNPSISQSPAVGSTYQGTTPFSVTMYAQDVSGNIDSCTFTFTPQDTISPSITCPGNISSCNPVVSFALPSASDNCGTALVTQTTGLPSGSNFPVGITTNTFQATDLSGNTKTCSFDVEIYDIPDVTVTGTDPLCAGDANGSADATVIGGTPNYFYDWSNGASTEDLSGVSAGTYTIVVTDDNGCKDSTTVTLTDPPGVEVSGSVTNVSCFGQSDGAIDAAATGGTGTLTYMWSTGSSNEDVTGLTGASYTLVVTDGNNCTVSTDFTVSEPDSISVSYTASEFSHGHNVSVNGASDGEIDVSFSGGTGPYTYLWSNGSTDLNQEDLPAGTYVLTITDNNGCEKVVTIVLTEPVPVQPANAFSPNGDGMNDYFVIKNIEDFPGNKLSVMNRWGDVVYKMEPYSNNWDGSANRGLKLYGKQLPEGSYFYILVLEKGTKPIRGSIVLKR